MRGEGARRADEGLSLEAAKTAKDLPPTERWSCFGGGFLAIFAARNDTRRLCRASLGACAAGTTISGALRRSKPQVVTWRQACREAEQSTQPAVPARCSTA